MLNIRYDGGQYQVLVPDDSIFFSIKDVLFNHEYELFSQFELRNSRGVIIDVGAHAGLYSILASLYAHHVVALEPDERNYKALVNNISGNGLRNVTALRCALWSENGLVRFHSKPNSQLGSILAKGEARGTEVEALSLKALVNKVLSGSGASHIDLLKLDIEGAEFESIEESDSETLTKIQRIVCELHVKRGESARLTRKLQKCGFSYIILKRPIQKTISLSTQVVGDTKVKILIRAVNSMMKILGYSDKSSLLLYALRDRSGFVRTESEVYPGRIIETGLPEASKT